MDQYLAIAVKVCGVFLLMGVGAAARTGGWLTREADRSLATLVALILLPCFYFDRILASPDFSSLADAWLPISVGFGITAFGFGVALGTAFLMRGAVGLERTAQVRAFALCTGICNYGYVPFPLAEVFFPTAVATLMVHNCGVELALWSIGMLIIAGSLSSNWKRAVFSPPLISVGAALILKTVRLGDQLPEPIEDAVSALGEAAIPLGLVLSGAIIVDFLRDARLASGLRIISAAAVLRLLVLPLCMLAFARVVPISVELKQVLILQAAMPSATFPIVIVRLFDKDIDTALRVVLGTSLISLVTIPMWILIGTSWLGESVAVSGG